MMQLFTPYKSTVAEQIKKSFSSKEDIYAKVSPWGKDAAEKFSSFATQGKLIRGGLVLFGGEIFGSKSEKDLAKAGAAIEIMHSSLLIHDDIMDNDALRRGQPSIYKQYEQMAKRLGRDNAEHIGVSLGICAGDLGYFLAWEIIGQITHTNQRIIMQKIAHEVSLVGIAQMQDVASFNGNDLNEEQILHMYQYKTGRYSFSMPLAVGALLADQPASVIKDLEEFGEKVGVLFQLADDKLGLFGSPEQTGKMVGSDIKENKQTLYRALLFQHATPSEKEELIRLFGNHDIMHRDIQYIHMLIKKYDIDTALETLCYTYDSEAKTIITKLPITDKYKLYLSELVTYIQTRNQ
jgi:geranylgeranyl diphosphate synthase type I